MHIQYNLKISGIEYVRKLRKTDLERHSEKTAENCQQTRRRALLKTILGMLNSLLFFIRGICHFEKKRILEIL